MGCMCSAPAGPTRPAVPLSVTRLCLATFAPSHNAGYTIKGLRLIGANKTEGADQYETWIYIGKRGHFFSLIESVKGELTSEEDKVKSKDHKTSPFCWGERSDGTKFYIGGGDAMRAWIQQQPGFQEGKGDTVLAWAKGEPASNQSDYKVTFPCKFGTSGTALRNN